MKASGIYQIQSKIKPERVYIGSAINISERWRLHLLKLKNKKHPNSKLQNHFNKYGESDLQFSVLIGCEKDVLIKNEQFYIDEINPFFNICKIAGSVLGLKFSEESKNKLSKSHKGQTSWMKGRHHSAESNQKNRLAHLGKKLPLFTEEHKNNIGKSKRGNKYNLGRRHTEGTKEKNANSHRGNKNWLNKHHTEEAKENMRKAWVLRKMKKVA